MLLPPLIQKLEKENSHYLILPLGTSAKLAQEKNLFQKNILHLQKDLGITVSVEKSWDRYRSLQDQDLEKISSCVRPKKVVIGVSSKIQSDLAKRYKSQAEVYAYYDNFNPIDQSSYAPLVREIEKKADVFLVPSKKVAESSNAKKIVVVGQPTLDVWVKKMKSLNKKKLLKRLGFSQKKPFLTFVGGYDKDYQDVFSMFVQAMKKIPTFEALVSVHPRSKGTVERSILDKEKPKNIHNISLFLDTIEAVALSDIVICHHSTVGIQALFAGKKVIYLDLPSSLFTNPAIDLWKCSKKVTNQEELISEIYAQDRTCLDVQTLYRISGIPQNSLGLFYQEITQSR